jgi:hypothetical protein
MTKHILTIVIFYIFLSSCRTVKPSETIRDLKSHSINDSLKVSLIDKTSSIKIGHCRAINLNDYRSNTIKELLEGDFPYHCIINYAEKQDTLAQHVLYEICNMVGNNVYRFDYFSSSQIDMFLRQTLYLTPKSNKWIPVLMKYAKDNYCESDPSSHYSAGGHFGSWVTSDIIGNMTNKDYAKELGNFKYRILQEDAITNKKLYGCDLQRRRHKIFMDRLEQDYKEGKLNFEQENK